ncbi:hypothetical protein LCGC14_1483450 [marine sediment metagenome]|uniref:Helicase/UvrB N-terminal domain-containing protein n=1 Tax=marine sediment metagenome TaxID=412755 RepID=A0A0F9JUQ6_9ZZZZ
MRHLIALPRRGGKTHAMIEAMKAQGSDAVLMVMNQREAQRIHHEYDLPLKQIVVAKDIEKLRGRFPRPRLYIDNAELILEQLLGEQIDTMSVTVGKVN